MALPAPIRSVNYDASTKKLLVSFRVGSYVFANVPQAVAVAFTNVAAGEDGEAALNAFHSTIEGKYKSERIGE